MPESNNKAENAAPEEEVEREFQWLIRPCNMYKEEYNDCTSIQARFHQYFIFGETIDCTQWKIDCNNCYLWNKYKDEKAYNDLVESEKKRRFKRLQGHYNNDVWQKRDKPPENWNAPLPEWMEERNKSSALKYMSEQLKKEANTDKTKESSCILM